MTLPVVLFLLTPGDRARRLRLASPYVALLGAHALLRYVVLGGMGGPWFVEYRLTEHLAAPFTSLLTTSTILFGSPLFLLIVGWPWWGHGRALLLAGAVWVVFLGVAFVKMSRFPDAEDYRYWLQATVLLAFGVAVGARFIGSRLVRVGYSLLLLGALAIQAAATSPALHQHFEREAALAGQISQSLVRPDLAGAVIVAPETPYIHSQYLASMAALYERAGLRSRSPAIYPAELLGLEPRLVDDARGVYRVTPAGVIRVSPTELRALAAPPRLVPSARKPGIEVHAGPPLQSHLGCQGPDPAVTLFTFRGRRLQFVDRMVIPYRPTYRLGLLVDGDVRATVVAIDDVLFGDGLLVAEQDRDWLGASAYAGACTYPDGHSTPLSDAVVVRPGS